MIFGGARQKKLRGMLLAYGGKISDIHSFDSQIRLELVKNPRPEEVALL
jgi:hypothetical protein